MTHRVRLVCSLAALGMLSACGGVKIKPEPSLPAALILPIPAKVGVLVPSEQRHFNHKETRWGVDWEIELGAGHQKLARDLFKAAFTDVEESADLEKLREMSGLKAIFEPRIEQYSFATARETGGRYYAVTIRYRVNLLTPTGEKSDSYTLTGYGNALAKGMSSGKPLARASINAMRDAAAKFLVQFPDQPAGRRLALNEPVEVEKPQGAAALASAGIEAVPINEPREGEVMVVVPPPPPATPVVPPPAVEPAPNAAPASPTASTETPPKV